jgi:hypothetical protein
MLRVLGLARPANRSAQAPFSTRGETRALQDLKHTDREKYEVLREFEVLIREGGEETKGTTISVPTSTTSMACCIIPAIAASELLGKTSSPPLLASWRSQLVPGRASCRYLARVGSGFPRIAGGVALWRCGAVALWRCGGLRRKEMGACADHVDCRQRMRKMCASPVRSAVMAPPSWRSND